MTGAVLPAGVDTRGDPGSERASRATRCIVPPGQRPARTRAAPARICRPARPRSPPGRRLRPADIGLIASLGHRRSHGAPPRARRLLLHRRRTGVARPRRWPKAQIYDSNRYTLYGMLDAVRRARSSTWAWCRTIRRRLEAAFREAIEQADAIITSGGVSVGEADFIKQLMAQLGEVLFWKIAMKPGRPMAFGRISQRRPVAPVLFGLPGNPVAVMVTFYQFVRGAAASHGRRRPRAAGSAAARHAASSALKKAPRAHRVPARRAVPARTASGTCASPARRARASCARCRRPTASSCSNTSAAASSRATRCRCN